MSASGHGSSDQGKRRVSIRPAVPDEAPMLTEIARASKASWGYPQEWLTAWEEALTISPEFIRSNPVFVAVESGPADVSRIAGVVALEDGEDGPEIAHLWVRPDRQGEGVGRLLMSRAVAEARSIGWDRLRILSDPHASVFYERIGAVRVGSQSAPVEGTARELPVLSLPIDPS